MLEILTSTFIISGILSAIIGLVIGSFLNVIIVRYPQMLERDWRQQSIELLQLPPAASNDNLNLCTPRSHCPHCQQALMWRDMIPLFSYLWLRGQCRLCHQAIAKHYPLVELITAAATVIALYRFGLSWHMLAACIFSWYLITLTVIDINTQLLPDVLTLSLLWIGLLINVAVFFTTPTQAILAAAMGYLLLWLIAFIFKHVRKKAGMGYGDFKLLAALGAWLGIIPLINVIFIAAIIGIIANVILLFSQKIKYNQPLAFGPALAVAGWVVLMFGPLVTNGLMGA